MDKPTAGLFPALLQAQKDMGPVKKDATNPAYRSKYATLESVLSTVEKPLADNGLVLLQQLEVTNMGQELHTTITHAATGESISSSALIVCKDMADPQKIGGAISYFRRYSLMSMLGLAPEDDDGTQAATPSKGYSQPASEPITGWCEVPGCFNTIKDVDKSKRYNKGHAICYTHSTNGNWEALINQDQEPTTYDIARQEFDQLPIGDN